MPIQDLPLHLKRFYAHLHTAKAVLEAYQGEVPFAHYIKNFLGQHKKFGSKDRKQITGLCYGFFRLGKSYPGLSTEQRMLKAYQLLLKDPTPEWVALFEQFGLPAADPDHIFAFKALLSPAIDAVLLEESFLRQPDLFVRIRPGGQDAVISKLQAAAIDFEQRGTTLRLPNGSKIADILRLDQEAVVQDYSSQQVGALLHAYRLASPAKRRISVWDCCAASGGKSILVRDTLEPVALTVSDIRPTMLINLKKRFAAAGIDHYHAFTADATRANPQKKFDLIIADVPCTGSGTWARTPEQLVFFQPEKIEAFEQLQQNIISNVMQYLKPGGFLLYITCSVFVAENENQVSRFTQNGLTLVTQSVLKGYDRRADTMFAALLRDQQTP